MIYYIMIKSGQITHASFKRCNEWALLKSCKWTEKNMTMRFLVGGATVTLKGDPHLYQARITIKSI